jgi:lipid II:glycine glycyltransferase (peptidoglycan interpeptide bridge formation enzyme)
MLMGEEGYDYDLIGLVDNDNNILAASLILLKEIHRDCYYGYAPRGFLIDYNNTDLLKEFTELLKDYYYNKNTVFIKVNPNVIIGQVKENYITDYNINFPLVEKIQEYGYKKLRDNLYFEAQLPRFNAIIDLKKFDIKNVSKNTRNKIKKGIRKGLSISKYSEEYLNEFINLANDKTQANNYYYKDLYTVFNKENKIDLFLVSVDYNYFLINSQKAYDIESENNVRLNKKLTYNASEKVINNKMTSDRILLSYKNDIILATKNLNNNEKKFIAGALVIKHNNTVNVIASAFDRTNKAFAPNYFLYYELINYYKNDYDYLDMGGVVGDFLGDNPYSGLNRFKLGFNPNIYEYMGEYDLLVEPVSYRLLLEDGVLSKIFNKK